MSESYSEGVARWDARAHGYAQLVRSHAVFTELADRLLDALPAPSTLADVAAGDGLLAARALLRWPGLRVEVCEPAPRLLDLARRRLGERATGYHALAAEQLGGLPITVEAIAISAALHLVDVPAFFAAAASRLHPGGILAANLWGHSFEATAHHPFPDWRGPLSRALAPCPLPDWTEPPPRVLGRAALEAAAAGAGWRLERLAIHFVELDARFALAFRAMDPGWLGELTPEQRREVLAQALVYAEDRRRVPVVELRFSAAPRGTRLRC